MNPNTYIQPKLKSRLAASAIDVGTQKSHLAAYDCGVGMEHAQPKQKSRAVAHACRVGMDFGSTD